MNLPLISVVIPTFNRSRLLVRAIESVIPQMSEYIEIVISDNCSDDDTHAVVDNLINSYPNLAIRYFRNESNIGMVGNWRVALQERAKGEYCLILSDDDYLLDPDYLKLAVDVILSEKYFGLIFCRCSVVDSETREVNRLASHAQLSVPFSGPVSNSEILSNWGRLGPGVGLGFTIMLQTAIFNRRQALDIGCFTKDIISIDYHAWFNMMSEDCGVFFIDVIGAAYAVHSQNETSRNPPILEKWIENFDCYLEPQLCKSTELEKNFVDKEILRIITESFTVWPGTLLTVYNFQKVLKLTGISPMLRKGFLRAVIKPPSLLRILFSIHPSFYIFTRKIYRYLKFKLSVRC